MAAQEQKHWYNDRELFFHGFVRSNYITAFTDWFMGLAGKATELVLYATVLYSCAQLYPGVHLPTGLSLAVFLVQMGALDIGGLSLGKLAKQAREDGNPTGADQAATLSKWLIGIMLVGVVTVGLEHALPVALPSWVITSIDVLLVVGRSIAAVLYGRVVHALKQETTVHQANDLTTELTEKFSSQLTTAIEQVRQEFSNQVVELSQMFSTQVRELTRMLNNQGDQVQGNLATIHENIAAHDQALNGLAGLPEIVERCERGMRQALQQLTARVESSSASKPKLSLVTSEKLSESEGELTNKEFITAYLNKHPEARNIDVIEAGSKLSLNISQAHVSQIRKALKEQSA